MSDATTNHLRYNAGDFRAMALFVKAGLNGEEAPRGALERYQDLLTLASFHIVLPLFCKSQAVHNSPVSAASYEQVSKRTKVHNIFLLKEISRLQHGLYKKGIPSVVMKGPILSSAVYPSLGDRSCNDLDVLIRPQDWKEFDRHVRENGYRAIGEAATNEQWRGRVRRYLDQQVSYIRGPGVYQLDVHFRLFPPMYRYPLSTAEVLQRAEKMNAEEYEVWTLSSDDHLSLLCYHGLKNRFERLKYVVDIHCFVTHDARGLNWQRVIASAHRAGSTNILIMGLMMAKSFFGTRLPEEILQMAKERPAVMACVEKLQERMAVQARVGEMVGLDRLKFNWTLLETMSARVGYIAHASIRRLWDTILGVAPTGSARLRGQEPIL